MFLHTSPIGITILLIYVDDIIITGNDLENIAKLKEFLHISFKMKDLGRLTYFLGLEVLYLPTGIMLTQQKYASDLVAKAGLTDDKVVYTPMEINTKYREAEGEPFSDPTLYRQLVGSLVYLTMTRPDISYAVQVLSQFVANIYCVHYTALLRVIRYVRGSMSQGVLFRFDSPTHLEGYTDADWAGCPDSRRSITGWCMFFGTSLISWKCKKQSRTSKSSTEAEYRAMSAASSEIVWLQRLLSELGVAIITPTVLHADNTSAIKIATNPVQHENTKHIDVDCHYIRELIVDRLITLRHISSHDQLADLFTKAMTRARHRYLTSKLLLCDHQYQFEGGC